MYIDIHSHLLPAVDDGVQNCKDSLACLGRASRERISTIVMTPHIWPERFPNTPARLKKAFDEWLPGASRLGITLHLGCEAHFRLDMAAAWESGKYLAIGPSGIYLLIELPFNVYPVGAARVMYDLRIAGVDPVLAHPERYSYVVNEPARLADLARAAVPFQITTHSVVGTFGRAIQKTAFALLERGWGSILASDAHSLEGRFPLFREAVRVISSRYGKEAARRLCIENPRRILEGDQVLPVVCTPGRGMRSVYRRGSEGV